MSPGAARGSARPGKGSVGEPRRLANEREFLRQSIEDLERELASGEVDAADFDVLQAATTSVSPRSRRPSRTAPGAGRCGASPDRR